MAETHVIGLLGALTKTDIESDTDCAKLIGKDGRAIAGAVTSLIYQTLRCTSASGDAFRLNLIKLLQQWCQMQRCDMRIGANNYGVLVGNDGLLFSNPDPDPDCSVMGQFLARSATTQQNLAARKELMQQSQCRRFQTSQFDFNFVVPKTHTKTAEFAQLLAVIGDVDDRCRPCAQKTVDKRSIDVQTGYALLNLTAGAAEKLILLRAVLKDVSVLDALDERELKFVQHLWVCCDGCDTLRTLEPLIVGLFPFVLENSLIELATRVVDVGDDVFGDAEMLRVLRLCAEHRAILMRSVSIMYELYVVGGYNRNVLRIIEQLNVLCT